MEREASRQIPARHPRPGTLGERALDAARQILEDTGDESRLTLRAIARHAGVAAPSLYGHFEDLADLKTRVVERAFDTFLGYVQPSIDSPEPARQRVGEFLAAYVRFGREHPELYRLLFTRVSPSEMPEIGRRSAAVFADLVGMLSTARGESAVTAAVQALCVSVWFEVHGIASLPPANPRFPWPADNDLVDAVTSRALGTL